MLDVCSERRGSDAKKGRILVLKWCSNLFNEEGFLLQPSNIDHINYYNRSAVHKKKMVSLTEQIWVRPDIK